MKSFMTENSGARLLQRDLEEHFKKLESKEESKKQIVINRDDPEI
jgi:hypothetical protein